MRISPVYTTQNLISNPPHISNHPMLEIIETSYTQLRKSDQQTIFRKKMS